MPMATPTSACLSDGASLTPSPVMATIWPCACRARTMRSLCSGLVRAKTETRLTTPSRSPSESFSTSRPVITCGSSEIELARDGECGCGMVAGDHLEVDPGGAAPGDRLFRFKARRIDEADQYAQLDARPDVVERHPHYIRWQ